jgi:acetyltransferase-like isoleucine patch superfamily enzyme
MRGRRKRRLINAIRRRIPFTERRQILPPGLVIGRHTYGFDDAERTFPIYTEGARIIVGAFCSISSEARVLGGGEHVIDRASTFPLKARLFDPAERTLDDSVATGPTVIGNDVYIGVGAIVLGGVTIGDGAVVGAGAVVSKVVPPYAVVVGNPARILRYRFETDIQQRLLALRWWDWDDEELLSLLPWFMQGVEPFLEESERRRAAR